MNSFKAVYKALEYEAERQRRALLKVKDTAGNEGLGGGIRQDGFAAQQGICARLPLLLPGPPPLTISRWWSRSEPGCRNCRKRRDRFMTQYALPLYDANLLTVSRRWRNISRKRLKQAKYPAERDRQLAFRSCKRHHQCRFGGYRKVQQAGFMPAAGAFAGSQCRRNGKHCQRQGGFGRNV